ncbi:FMN-binding negative transcriptional regulator [uncultured Algibacter sp.]|uniref:FMN-binding negative transcriptional regulator n=1 Tax=uncultured Algibacter sp. TaxID=298659 RepID=UPI0026269F07|nr:FMN-binding negative transcriptional regulator [uncultured Algibacter sp.]
MKYPPKYHQSDNITQIIEVIKAYPLATIISTKNNVPFITHLPLIYNEEGKLIGHIDKHNPQTQLLNNNEPITVVFSGPDSYISPSLFEKSRLPTWNYIKVHLKGSVKTIKNKSLLKQSLIDMTAFLEGPENKFILNSDNSSMAKYIEYISMFEITIMNWEGKFKLSQDKPKKDIIVAKEALIANNQKDIEPFLKNLI